MLRIVLAVLVTRQNKGVDKESAPCYGLLRLALPRLVSLSSPFLSSLLRALPLSLSLSLYLSLVVRAAAFVVAAAARIYYYFYIVINHS